MVMHSGWQVYGEVKAKMASLKLDLLQRDKTSQVPRLLGAGT